MNDGLAVAVLAGVAIYVMKNRGGSTAAAAVSHDVASAPGTAETRQGASGSGGVVVSTTQEPTVFTANQATAIAIRNAGEAAAQYVRNAQSGRVLTSYEAGALSTASNVIAMGPDANYAPSATVSLQPITANQASADAIRNAANQAAIWASELAKGAPVGSLSYISPYAAPSGYDFRGNPINADGGAYSSVAP